MDRHLLTAQLDWLECIDEADGPGPAQPFLWLFAVVIDGETVHIDADHVVAHLSTSDPLRGAIKGRPRVLRGEGGHGNLGLKGRNISAGQSCRIPPGTGRLQTIVRPLEVTGLRDSVDFVALSTAVSIPGVIMVIGLLMEEDAATSDEMADAAFAATVDGLREEVRKLLAGLGRADLNAVGSDPAGWAQRHAATIRSAVREQAFAAAKKKATVLALFGSQDDTIGSAEVAGSILDVEPGPRLISEHWDGDHGHWHLHGSVWATRLPLPRTELQVTGTMKVFGAPWTGVAQDGRLCCVVRSISDRFWRRYLNGPADGVWRPMRKFDPPPLSSTSDASVAWSGEYVACIAQNTERRFMLFLATALDGEDELAWPLGAWRTYEAG